MKPQIYAITELPCGCAYAFGRPPTKYDRERAQQNHDRRCPEKTTPQPKEGEPKK